MRVRMHATMPTRPCKLSLALQDDTVFADFDVDEGGCLFLVGISFDGYGYCDLAWAINPVKMPLGDSRKLFDFAEAGQLSNSSVSEILTSYFVACGEQVWQDALREHNLV